MPLSVTVKRQPPSARCAETRHARLGVRGELDAVRDQVLDQPTQQALVAAHGGQLVDLDLRAALVDHPREVAERVADDAVHVDEPRGDRDRSDARVGEQVGDQLLHARDRVERVVDELVGLVVELAAVAAGQQLDVARDDPQRLGEVVARDVGEVGEIGVRPRERVLVGLAVGDVLARADHPHGAPVLHDHLAVREHDADAAVRPDQAVLVAERPMALQRLGDRALDLGPVVGVHALEELAVVELPAPRVQSVDPVHLVRPGDRVGLDVPLPAADVGDPLCERELLLAAQELLVRGVALGDVADDLAEVAPVRALPARDRELEREQAAVLAQTRELDRTPGLAAGMLALERRAVRVALGLGHEHRQRLAEHLLGSVAEHRRGARVPEEDVAVPVGEQDGLGRRLGDGTEARLGLAQRLLGLLAHDDRPELGGDRGDHLQQPRVLGVLVVGEELDHRDERGVPRARAPRSPA